MARRSYVDIGAVQRRESGSSVARHSYVDIGALQRQEAAASASAALTGTALTGITEADIVAGGKTIIITLSGETFIPV